MARKTNSLEGIVHKVGKVVLSAAKVTILTAALALAGCSSTPVPKPAPYFPQTEVAACKAMKYADKHDLVDFVGFDNETYLRENRLQSVWIITTSTEPASIKFHETKRDSFFRFAYTPKGTDDVYTINVYNDGRPTEHCKKPSYGASKEEDECSKELIRMTFSGYQVHQGNFSLGGDGKLRVEFLELNYAASTPHRSVSLAEAVPSLPARCEDMKYR
jgi:hypothetical protein